MSDIKDGGPAFPVWELNGQGQQEMTCFGMTLRDYFAAKALPVVINEYVSGASKSGFDKAWRDGVAMDSYRMADAMLKARQS